jgi:hypothetical protein
MSVQLNYGSEIIEQLPTSFDPLHPEEYARIAPLLEEGSKIIYPMKRYFLLMGLFIVFSYNFIDRMLVAVSPSLGMHPMVTMTAKAFMFIVIVYIIDNVLTDNNK